MRVYTYIRYVCVVITFVVAEEMQDLAAILVYHVDSNHSIRIPVVMKTRDVNGILTRS